MKILELFSGTGSISKISEELGWDCYSVDITDKFYKVDAKVDILTWDYTELNFKPDIIWASPPCSPFSRMLFLTKTKEQIKEIEKKDGLPLLNKTLEIIKYFNPKYYFIENPDTGRMKNYITNLDSYRVSYCRYSENHSRKDTRIWTNLKGFNPKICNHKGKHKVSITTTRKNDRIQKGRIFKNDTKAITTIRHRYSIPPELIRGLFMTIKEQ